MYDRVVIDEKWPCFDTYGNVLFDGKIGTFPFIYKEPAKRNNKNRVAGTLVTKPILLITQDVIRSCLIEKSLQYREAPKTIDELVAAVEKSFQELSPSALNRVFLTFQECMIEVLKCKRGNDYKIPHMRKENLEKENCLPVTLSVDHELLEKVLSHLQS
ncbi:hypothetical protein LIER_35737 [Lithospermum erythrorhizon]|uniref:Uncharacterized protein n=1 Tax=Lithospermum erythrorhizon TaxID=34254 RepID=A0AAV3NVN2_LITER